MIGRPAVRGHVGGGPNWPLYRCVASALGPGPGMPGAPGRPPGWRRRGCRRPPRTGRPATSRRPATRRPRQAGPVRSRQGRLPRPAPRTGAWCSARRARCTRAGTARVVPARGSGSARLAPYQFSASAARWRNTTPGKVLSRECRGASLLTSPEMSASRASPLRICRAVTVSSGPAASWQAYHGGKGRTTGRRAALPADASRRPVQRGDAARPSRCVVAS